MKLLVCLTLLCLTFASTNLRNNPTILQSSDSDLQDLQALFNGFAQNVNTAWPNIDTCVDEASAGNIKDFFSTSFDNLAACDFVAITKGVEALKASVSADINTCLNNDQAVIDALVAYGIKDVSAGIIVSKFAAYALTGYADELANQASQVKNAFKREDYQEAGNLFGKLLQTVMNHNPEDAPETTTVFALDTNEEESSDYDNSEGDLTPASPALLSLRGAANELLNDSSDDDNRNIRILAVAANEEESSDYDNSEGDDGKIQILAVAANEEESSDYDNSEGDLTPTSQVFVVIRNEQESSDDDATDYFYPPTVSLGLRSAAKELLNDSSDDDNSDNKVQILAVATNEEESSDYDNSEGDLTPASPVSLGLRSAAKELLNDSSDDDNSDNKIQILAVAANEEESSDYDNSEDDLTPASQIFVVIRNEQESSDDDATDYFSPPTISLGLRSAAKELLNDSSDDDNSDNDKARPAIVALHYDYDGNYNNNYDNNYNNNYGDHGRKI